MKPEAMSAYDVLDKIKEEVSAYVSVQGIKPFDRHLTAMEIEDLLQCLEGTCEMIRHIPVLLP